MSLLFYRKTNGPGCTELEKILHDLGLGDKLEIFPSLRSLHRRIRKSCYDVSSVLLCISGSKELEEILESRERYLGLRVLVVPMGQELEELKRIHDLHPRYVCAGNGHFADLVEVLRKVYGKDGSENTGIGEW